MLRSILLSAVCVISSSALFSQDTLLPLPKRTTILSSDEVQTVSKKKESLQTTPATVVVITRKQLIERGYVDIVDAIQDLPGFDVNKIQSKTYANLFQLGLRQDNTERTLLMVDGVEENDLWSNWSYLSRQYPISQIKSIEVIYGPVTSLYGPRGMIGAINIITLDPDESLSDPLLSKTTAQKSNGKKSNLSVYGNLLQGNFKSRSADLTMNLKGKPGSDFSMQITGRYYRSDEHRMQGEFYDYDPSDIDSFTYNMFTMTNSSWNGGLNNFMRDMNMPMVSPYYTVFITPQGNINQITLTQAGRNRARQLDKEAYAGVVNGAPVGYSNATEDYYLGVKIKVADFTIGLRHWKLQEGNNFYQDVNEAGSANGSIWAPMNTSLYAQVQKKIGSRSSIYNLSTFSVHSLGKESNRVSFMSYGDPSTRLHIAHLLYPDSIFIGRTGVTRGSLTTTGTQGTLLERSSRFEHGWRNRYYYYQAMQARNEFRYQYTGRDNKFNLISGIDLRYTQTQGDYLTYQDFDTKLSTVQAFKDKQASVSLAKERGIAEGQLLGNNSYDIIDLGLFAQASYRVTDRFIVSAEARRDQNIIRNNGGFGTRVSPKLALVYTHNPMLNLKAIYSQGIQNASQRTRYSTDGGLTANTNLNAERIDYLSLEWSGSYGKQQSDASLQWSMVGFWYRIQDGIAVKTNSTTGTKMNIHSDTYRVKGLMTSLSYRLTSNVFLQANHSFTSPERTASVADSVFTGVRIGDVASHRINVGATGYFEHVGLLRLSLNVRSQYVAGRKVGAGTSVPKNLGVDASGTIPDYLVLHGNLGITVRSFPYLRLDLGVENILDALYYHAGPRQADASFNMPGGVRDAAFADQTVPFMSQRGRFTRLRITYNLH